MKTIAGINIRAPWSSLLLSGEKTIETRTYPIPKKHEGMELAVIETPGPKGKFKARIVGIIIFEPSYQYRSKKMFYSEKHLHLVNPNDKDFGWPDVGTKWAWPVKSFIKFDHSFPAPRPRGIVFASNCKLPKKY